jgi:CAAX prenyl protease-like protein
MASARAKVEAGGVVNPAAEYLAPLLALVGSTMVGAALTAGFDATYPVRVLATAAALWAFRRRYAVQSRPVTWTAVAIGVAVFAVWMALEPGVAAPGADGAIPAALGRLPEFWAAYWLIFRVVGSVVTVPIAEELAFRGYLTRRLIDADFSAVPPGRFSWPSFLISSALFGALHGRWLAGMLAGAAYALAYYRRGRLADPVVAHATTNGLIAAWVLAPGRWSLWT